MASWLSRAAEERKLTPSRLAWLRHLKATGPTRREGHIGNAGSYCMKAGWTEWLCALDDGTEITLTEYQSQYPKMVGPKIIVWREQITAAGLDALGEHESSIEEEPPTEALDRLTLVAERSKTGLWFVTSPEHKGLLVAKPTLKAALTDVPRALKDLAKARSPVP